MITTAATPEPTPASTRGATPKTSLPVGSSVPLTSARVGANRTTPAVKPLSNTSNERT